MRAAAGKSCRPTTAIPTAVTTPISAHEMSNMVVKMVGQEDVQSVEGGGGDQVCRMKNQRES